jgi:hypothetical protein
MAKITTAKKLTNAQAIAAARATITESVDIPATRTAEQQAAIDALRVEKEVAAAEAAAHKEFDPEEMAAVIKSKLADMFRSTGLEFEPSWKRKLATWFTCAALSFGVGYTIGTLASWAIVGIATLGGSLLWSYLIITMALILAVYAGLKVGQHVGNYILSGKIDHDLVAAKNKVVGWFTPAPKVITVAA